MESRERSGIVCVWRASDGSKNGGKGNSTTPLKDQAEKLPKHKGIRSYHSLISFLNPVERLYVRVLDLIIIRHEANARSQCLKATAYVLQDAMYVRHRVVVLLLIFDARSVPSLLLQV